MDETEVAIVGAGPSGLVLGLLLAQYEVKSIILEKEWSIQEDPRGIVVTGDGVRTLYNMGLGQALADVSQEHQNLKFHLDNFKNAEYLRFPQNLDLLEQTLASVVFMAQPRLVEKVLRQSIEESGYCELRVGCEVRERQDVDDGVIIEYVESATECQLAKKADSPRKLRAHWLVGADGKKGVVRKRFLEPAGITQQVGKYAYTGTWIAANLQIFLPTPETHPDLPVWALDVSPEKVYEIFWPADWHFCTHPKEAVAAGRFGPAQDRLWRHEFELESWKDGMDALEMFWANITPSITRDASSIPGLAEPMTYPRDCIKVLRCRPFTFVQKVAEPAWHNNRTIIIGDAAHVFPPFGGQGIASGVRDAVGLSWRLAILTKLRLSGESATANALLTNWFGERRQGIDDSADITMTNGKLTNQKWRLSAYAQAAVGRVLIQMPWLLNIITKNIFRDDLGYKSAKVGFFLPEHGGGGKMAQIFVQLDSTSTPIRSDAMLRHTPPLMTILVISNGKQTSATVAAAKELVQMAALEPLILSVQSVCVFDAARDCKAIDVPKYSPCILGDLKSHDITPFPGYNEKTFLRRLGSGTKLVIVRPDTIIFSLCKDVEELDICVRKMKSLIS